MYIDKINHTHALQDFTMEKLTEDQNNLVKDHINFVHFIVNKYKNAASDRDDITSAGYYGLVKAAKSFNPNKGVKFITFAGTCINNSIKDLLEEQKRKRSRSISFENLLFSRKVLQDVELDYLQYSVYGDAYDTGERIEEQIIDDMESVEQRLIMGLYLVRKPPRYAHIVKLKLQNKTNVLIANEIGISKSYISRILTKIERELILFNRELNKIDNDYLSRYTQEEIDKAKMILKK